MNRQAVTSTQEFSTGQAPGRHAARNVPAARTGDAQAGAGLQTLVSEQPGSMTAIPPATDLFTRNAERYAATRSGQQVSVLIAGATTAPGDLGAGQLREAGVEISVSLIDDGEPVTRSAVATQAGLGPCALGDLRAAALAPRSLTAWSPPSSPGACSCSRSATGTVRPDSSTGCCPGC